MPRCVWCERSINPTQPSEYRTLQEPDPTRQGVDLDGVVHERCLAVFRALVGEVLPREEITDRLEFLEGLCRHGPFKAHIDNNSTLQAYRCIKCGAPADHQLESEDIVE